LTLVGVVVTAVVRLTLVVWQSWGIPGMVVAAAATHVVNGIVALWLTRQWWWGRVDWSLMQLLWRRGLPLVPSNIAVWLLLYEDRWLLAGVVTPAVQGHYAVAALLVSLLALVIDPFRNAWQPLALTYTERPTAGDFYATSLRVYVAVALLAAMVIGLWAPELLWLFGGSAAQPAAQLLWPLLLVPLCSGVITIVGIVPTTRGKLTILGWSTAAAALVNTLLNLWLIPIWGAMGAGIATGIAAVVMPSMIWWQARRMLAVAYAWWLMAGYGVLAVGAVVLAIWLGADWGVRLGVVIGYGVVVGGYEYRLSRRASTP
jgi:O-antigen/teichoic acid export membrane protein